MTCATCREAAVLDGRSTLELNPLPAPTWHRFDLNAARFSVPDLPDADSSSVHVEAPVGVGVSEGASGGPFIPVDIETGLGPEGSAWLTAHAARRLVVEVPAGLDARELLVVRVSGVDGARAVASLDVHAGAGSRISIAIESDSPQPGCGLVGERLRIVADEGSSVEVSQMQTLDDGWLHLADVGLIEGDGARVQVVQTILGGRSCHSGLAADLRGYRSACRVETFYLGQGAGSVDLNYVLRQRGARTEGGLSANGILVDAARKVLRGTIDFVRGCKGAVGRETESVLLVGDDAQSKTIPVILCGEDDVQGDHGATTGHIDARQLGYLQARGLTASQAEDLFVEAVFDASAARAGTAASVAAVRRLAAKRGIRDLEENEREGA